MKNKAAAILKQIIATLSSMAKAKSLALKSKTRAIKTRLIILSLLSKKKFLMSSLSHSIQQKKSSISHKLNTLLGHHHHHHDNIDKHDYDDENDVGSGQSKAIVLVYQGNNINAMTHEDQTRTDDQYLLEEAADDKYPDLTHSLFDSEDLDFEDPGGSVIDLLKTSKEGAGEEFSLEDEIDHVADLFIKRFHRQMRMQKQLSLNRYQPEMLQRSA